MGYSFYAFGDLNKDETKRLVFEAGMLAKELQKQTDLDVPGVGFIESSQVACHFDELERKIFEPYPFGIESGGWDFWDNPHQILLVHSILKNMNSGIVVDDYGQRDLKEVLVEMQSILISHFGEMPKDARARFTQEQIQGKVQHHARVVSPDAASSPADWVINYLKETKMWNDKIVLDLPQETHHMICFVAMPAEHLDALENNRVDDLEQAQDLYRAFCTRKFSRPGILEFIPIQK